MSIKAKTKRRLTVLVIAILVALGGLGGLVVIKKQRYAMYVERARGEGMAAAKAGDSRKAVDKLTEYLSKHWDDVDALVVYAKERPKVDPKDVAMLEDLIVAATNAALRAVQTLVQSEGGPLANLKSMFPGMMP